MTLAPPTKRPQSEPTIALINVVFLMLIFFMIAGTLAPSIDDEVKLIETAELDGRAPPDVAVIRADGTMLLRGNPITPAELVAASEAGDDEIELRVIADRDLPATALMSYVGDLRAAGANGVWIITDRGLNQ